MRRFILLCLPAALLITGCGGSPTSPANGGATISGAVVGPAGSTGGSSQTAPSSGLTVSVVGTGPRATVDSTDNFTLTNVPAGNVDLQFSGQGMNAQVPLGTIAASEKVSVTVMRNGASMTLDCIRRMGGDSEQLEGRIDGLPPATAAGTFTISGQSVQTDTNTKFFKGDAAATFADMAIGMRVHVKGTPNATGVLAREVRIQNVNVDLGVEVEGLIADFTGTAASFQFTVNGRTIKGDATTVFETGTLFTSLVNGARVEVHGKIMDGFIFATKIEVEMARP